MENVMKKTIKFCVSCIIASVLFSSCGSNMSITKRHYNNGYYISYSNDKENVIIPKENKTGIHSSLNESLYFPNDQTKEPGNEKFTDQKEIKVNNVVATSYSKIHRKENLQKKANKIFKHISKITNTSEINIKSDLIEKNKIKSSSSQEERDGLSLFWIVILAILIFWAVFFSIGFLLEGLINLLLIIALILLILWLLRIL